MFVSILYFFASLSLPSFPFLRHTSDFRGPRVRWCGWAKLSVLFLLLLAAGSRLPAQSTVVTDTVGTYPAGIAINPATNTIYVTNHDSNTVSVINGATNTMVATIPVGNNPMAIAVNPVTNTIYVGNFGETSVSVISGVTNAVTATLTVGTNPAAIAVDSAANIIYVADWGSSQGSIINGATNAVTTLTSGQFPSAMASNPVTTMAYSVNYNNSSPTVSVLDGANASIANITSAASVGPLMVAVNPITNTIYSAEGNRDWIEYINGATNALVSVKLGIKAYTQSAILLNPITNFIYIANLGSNSVTVIDGATRAVVSNLAVGTAPTSLAIDTQTNTIYVANNASYTGTTINVINGATATAPATVSGTIYTVGAGPAAMAVNPVTNTLYVANAGSPTTRGTTVSVINLATNAVSAPISVGSNPAAAAVNQATDIVYVANSGGNSVSVMNGATNAVSTVTVGATPKALAINPATNTIYVANQTDGTVSAIDGVTSAVTSVTVGAGPQAIAVNPATNSIYVANTGATTISVINGTSNSVSATVAVGTTPQAIAVNPATNTIYVANYGSGTVSAINGATNLAASVTVGSNPNAVAVNPLTNTIYVANYGAATVSVIDGSTDAVSSVAVGGGPHALVVNSATGTIYVANRTDGTVSVINGATNTVTATLSVGSIPYALSLNPLLNTVYVANQGGDTVSVINGATNTVSSVAVGSGPRSVAVNMSTGQVYVPNYGSATVSVLAPATINTVPLTTTIAPILDSRTVSTTNIFQTTNPTPSFTTTVTSAYTSSSTYTGSSQTPSPVNPNPSAVYYQVNGGSGVWLPVSPAASGNPATFTVTPPFQQLGLNTLYVYAAYGSEGTSAGALNQTGNSPEIGNITTLQYIIEPVATTTTLTADHTSQSIGMAVTFTASVTPLSLTASATGSVTFTSTSSASVVTTLCSDVPVVYTSAVAGTPVVPQTNQATCSANFSIGDTDTITATFLGTQNFSASSATLTETIEEGDKTTTTVGLNPISVALGGTTVLSATVADTTSPATQAVGSVTFYGTVGSITNTLGTAPVTNGVASLSYVATTLGANTITAAYTPSNTALFETSRDTVGQVLTVNLVAPTTVTVSTVSSVYGSTTSATVSAAESGAAGVVTGGIVTFGTSGSVGGSFNPATCTLTVQGTCTTVYTPSGTLAAGTYTNDITASFAAVSNYTASRAANNLSISQQSPVLTLLNVTTVTYPGKSNLSVSLSWTGSGAAPTGTVTFSIDSGTPVNASCTGTVTPILCTYSGSFAAGSHTLNASYVGDIHYTSASATAGSFSVLSDTSKLVFGTSPATPLTAGQNGGPAITVLEENPSSNLVVTATDPITLAVTGPVGFTARNYGPTNAIAGVASFNVSAAALTIPGTYTYTASSHSLIDAVATEIVNAAVSATTTISSKTLTEDYPGAVFTPVAGSGGTGALTYSVLPALPTGLSFSTAGVISGTPTAASAMTVYTVTVTDANSQTATGTFHLTIVTSVVATQTVATTSLTANQATQAFTPVMGSGGFGSLAYSILPSLPTGLSFDSRTGTIAGTPNVLSASMIYAITVTDTNNASATANFSLAVNVEAPTILFTVPTHIYGDGAFGVSASSTSDGAFTYSVVSGPATILGSTVTLTGAGTVTLQASEAANSNYSSATKNASFTVLASMLTIKANDATRFYGATNPIFTGSVSGAQPGDTFAEGFATSATVLSPVATYAIVPSVTGTNVSSYTETVVYGTLMVTQAPTSIILSTSSTSVASGQSVTFTAQVLPSASGTPTGIVTILDNGGPLTSLTLSGGSVSYPTTALSPGIAHVLTATYAGDGNFLGTAASGTPAGTVTITVTGTDTAITPTSGTSFSVIPGGALNFDLLLTPQPGAYPGPVTFDITGLPSGASATFTPPALTAVTSPTTVHVTIQTAAATAKLIRIHDDMGAIALGLLLLPISFTRRNRKRFGRLLFVVILLGGALSSMAITGCGADSSFFIQQAQNYTLTITATSGSVKHVATITLMIQ